LIDISLDMLKSPKSISFVVRLKILKLCNKKRQFLENDHISESDNKEFFLNNHYKAQPFGSKDRLVVILCVR